MDVIEYTFPRSQTGRPFYHCKVNFYYGVNMGFENCGANLKKKKKKSSDILRYQYRILPILVIRHGPKIRRSAIKT